MKTSDVQLNQDVINVSGKLHSSTRSIYWGNDFPNVIVCHELT
jgi:hypothetical protein